MSEGVDLSFASIAEIGTRLRERTLSCVELTEQCLARITRLNPKLNAFITVTSELAREQARAAQREIDAGHWRGPLHGVPVAVKDFYDTRGIRTTAGFEHFARRVPNDDADIVIGLREAGTVLVGKTNMHKLGMGTTSLDSHFGAVVNPWNARYVAGGSSGGSAAAIAAGLCFATIDTDAVGSGRLPAATCGVACHKPSFGVLSNAGILAGEPADPAIVLLSHPSVMARSPDDVHLAFSALTSASNDDAARIRRIGVVTNFAASDAIRVALASVVASLESMDFQMHEIEVPFAAASFDVRNLDARRAAINATLFRDVDVLALPTQTTQTPTVDDAKERGDMAVSADNTFFCNYFGLPSITVPCCLDNNGLPLGVQFVGPHGNDAAVLRLAQAYRQAVAWSGVPPELEKRN